MERKQWKHKRISYSIENDVNLWWSKHYRKWLKFEDKGVYSCSSWRMFRTKKNALKHLKAMGPGFFMSQTVPTKGMWKETIWTFK